MPRREDLQKTLGNIYDARSEATHWGRQFPTSASYSGGPRVPAQVAWALMSGSVFPPVVWFERIVNMAIRTFWERRARESEPLAGPADAGLGPARSPRGSLP
jgi:hypothetical protein